MPCVCTAVGVRRNVLRHKVTESYEGPGTPRRPATCPVETECDPVPVTNCREHTRGDEERAPVSTPLGWCSSVLRAGVSRAEPVPPLPPGAECGGGGQGGAAGHRPPPQCP